MGLDFDFSRKDLLIVDESDTIIFSDPCAFAEVLSRCRCICLTATPDDNDKLGAEKKVIDALHLNRYEYGFSAELTAPATINETKVLPDDDGILAFIKTKLLTTPVLLYCSPKTKEFIKTQG